MEYIKQSEYEDPLVCAICGAKRGEQHCSGLHAAKEAERQSGHPVPMGFVCPCPRCTPRC